MGNLSVAADKSYPKEDWEILDFSTPRCTDDHWSKVPSFGSDFKNSNIAKWRGLNTFCVQISTIAKTRTFPAGSSFVHRCPTTLVDSIPGIDEKRSNILFIFGPKVIALMTSKDAFRGELQMATLFRTTSHHDVLSTPGLEEDSKKVKSSAGLRYFFKSKYFLIKGVNSNITCWR